MLNQTVKSRAGAGRASGAQTREKIRYQASTAIGMATTSPTANPRRGEGICASTVSSREKAQVLVSVVSVILARRPRYRDRTSPVATGTIICPKSSTNPYRIAAEKRFPQFTGFRPPLCTVRPCFRCFSGGAWLVPAGFGAGKAGRIS